MLEATVRQILPFTKETMPGCRPLRSWAEAINSDSPSIPLGLIEVIKGSSDLTVYYSCPKISSVKGIVVFMDVWGFSVRVKRICDTLASEGYHVIMPDCFRGETPDTNPDMITWLRNYPYDSVLGPDVKACIDFLRSKGANESSIGTLGFSWGGWAMSKAASKGIGFKCLVGVYPAIQLEKAAFGGDEEAMMTSIDVPILLMPAGNDPENLKPESSLVKTLRKNDGKSILFLHMVHGWVTRGDTNDSKIKSDVESALRHAMAFFNANM